VKPYIKSFEKKEIFVERESLHREIRNVLAEQNMQDAERRFYELFEDLYEVIKEMDEVYAYLTENMLLNAHSIDCLDAMKANAQKATNCLEKWEKYILEQ
jgi:hypothetical protein